MQSPATPPSPSPAALPTSPIMQQQQQILMEDEQHQQVDEAYQHSASTRASVATNQLLQIQQEIAYLNDIGIDLFELGKLKTAAFHFNHALQRMKTVSSIKRQDGASQSSALPEEAPSSSFSALSSMVKKACQPLPIDTVSSPTSLCWEKVAALALIHNAALVHYKGGSYQNAKQLLELAINLMKREIRDTDLNQLLTQSKYASIVVISVYIALGKVMTRIPNSDAKQTKRAFAVASGLMKRFVDTRAMQRQRQLILQARANASAMAAMKNKQVPKQSLMAAFPKDDAMMSKHTQHSHQMMAHAAAQAAAENSSTGSSSPRCSPLLTMQQAMSSVRFGMR